MRKKIIAILGLTSCILLMVSCTSPTVDSVNEKLSVSEPIAGEIFEIPSSPAENEITLDSTYLDEIQVYQKRTICYHNAVYTFFDDAIHQVKGDNITRVFECRDAVGRIRDGYLYWAALTADNQIHIIRFDENGSLLEAGQIEDGKSLSGIDFYQDTLYVRYSIGSVEAYQLEKGIITGIAKEAAVSLYQDENRAAKIRMENPIDTKSISDIPYHVLDAGFSLEVYGKEFLAKHVAHGESGYQELVVREFGKEMVLFSFYENAMIYKNFIIYSADVDCKTIGIYDMDSGEQTILCTMENGTFEPVTVSSDVIYGIYHNMAEGKYFTGISLMNAEVTPYFEISRQFSGKDIGVSGGWIYYYDARFVAQSLIKYDK